MYAEAKAVQAALRRHAHAQAQETYTAAFRTLARERGGVNRNNREAIEREARQAANKAAEAVYLANGYTFCPDPERLGCTRLVTPGYDACPNCTPRFAS